MSIALQMTEGLAHLHSHGVKHLDMKPGNVLIVRNGSEEYGVRIADFGMDAEGEKQESGKEAEDEDTSVYGTWEYLSPECWQRRFGQPDFPSDVFSFGIILWELWACTRVFLGFHGIEDTPDANGKADVTIVPQRMAPAPYQGQRPEINEEWPCGPAPMLWSKLMQSCWQADAKIRPTFPQIKVALQRMPLDWSSKPEVAEEAEAELTNECFLQQLGLEDKKEGLADCGLDEGLELKQLGQMNDDELAEDILDDEDLELDEETKASFRAAVAALKDPLCNTHRSELTYDDFLADICLLERKAALAEYFRRMSPNRRLT